MTHAIDTAEKAIEHAYTLTLDAECKAAEKGEILNAMACALGLIAAQAAEIERLRDKIENAQQAASETHGTWEARCYAILTALELDYGQDKKTDAFRDALGEQVADIERLKGALRHIASVPETASARSVMRSIARAALSEREP